MYEVASAIKDLGRSLVEAARILADAIKESKGNTS
jgi:hypothetical protein